MILSKQNNIADLRLATFTPFVSLLNSEAYLEPGQTLWWSFFTKIVRIFSLQISVISPNAVKYGPENFEYGHILRTVRLRNKSVFAKITYRIFLKVSR